MTYMNLSNIEYVALAAYLLSAFEKPVDTEDIAIKAHEMAPERFCWKKYPAQINLSAVSKRLYDARTEKHGTLVEGSDKVGWIVTQKGVIWAQKISAEINSSVLITNKRVRSSGIVAGIQTSERKRISSTKAYVLYSAGKLADISLRDAEHVYRFDDYVDARTRVVKINKAFDIFSNDPDMIKFLKLIQKIVEKGNFQK